MLYYTIIIKSLFYAFIHLHLFCFSGSLIVGGSRDDVKSATGFAMELVRSLTTRQPVIQFDY